MINQLIEDRKILATKHKEKMDNAQQRIGEANKYEFDELLNANCTMDFHKGYYMALTREIKDLEELKKQINGKVLSVWDGDTYTDATLKEKVSEVNITKLIKDLGADINE